VDQGLLKIIPKTLATDKEEVLHNREDTLNACLVASLFSQSYLRIWIAGDYKAVENKHPVYLSINGCWVYYFLYCPLSTNNLQERIYWCLKDMRRKKFNDCKCAIVGPPHVSHVLVTSIIDVLAHGKFINVTSFIPDENNVYPRNTKTLLSIAATAVNVDTFTEDSLKSIPWDLLQYLALQNPLLATKIKNLLAVNIKKKVS